MNRIFPALLDQYARRFSVGPGQDAAAQFQVELLRGFLDTLESALVDEHVDPDTARRVLKTVIQTEWPNPAEVNLRTRMAADMTERLANPPTVFIDGKQIQ